MASSSSSSSDDVTEGRNTFVDPLSLARSTDDVPPQLQQKPRHSSAKTYHQVDVQRPVFVPHDRLHELPQWNASSTTPANAAADAVFIHSFQHPQWSTGFEGGTSPRPATVAVKKVGATEHACVTCKKEKEKCVCTACAVCQASVGRGSRHHCRRCWNAVCGNCRKRSRYINPMAWVNTYHKTCDICAVPRGLAHLTEDTSYVGVALLKEAMDAPLQCVDKQRCNTYTYRATCPSCALPTVPSRPHVERLVRVSYCCAIGRKCAKCASAEQRMRDFERLTEQARYRRFCEMTPEEVEAVWAATMHVPAGGLGGAFRWATDQHVRDIMLALLSSSVCYEYAAYPHTTLELSDVAAARRLLRLRECKQDFSIIDGPGDLVMIAFPGTHDIRTAVTDIRFGRTNVRQFGQINHGLMRSGPSQPYRLLNGGVHEQWHYRLHEGFAEEEMKLRSSLGSSTVRNVLSEGKRVVFCGHSLGGALATLVTLRLLEEDLELFGPRIKCITFGAPMVGNSALATKVRKCGWTGKFTHLVCKSDVVPRLLTERDMHRHAAIAIRTAVQSHVDRVKQLFSGRPSEPQVEMGQGGGKEFELGEASLQTLTEEDTVRRPGDEVLEREVDAGFTAESTTSVLEKRAFDCFGEYHFLQRNVPYKATVNHLSAYNALRDGDGLKIDIGDHLLDSYNKAIAVQLRTFAATRTAGAAPAAAAANKQHHQQQK